jgi:hypothetical protein
MPVERDATGVITNAKDLTADQVVWQPVRCPLCSAKDFKMWPFGWDAHAAHKCTALKANTGTDRKSEYKGRLIHLFR